MLGNSSSMIVENNASKTLVLTTWGQFEYAKLSQNYELPEKAGPRRRGAFPTERIHVCG
jgi:hypothetical protein